MDFHPKERPKPKPKLIGQSNGNYIGIVSANAMMTTEVHSRVRPTPLQQNRISASTNHSPIECMNSSLIPKILGFLSYKDIMRSRICCRKFRDAAKTTIVSGEFVLWSAKTHKKIQIFSQAMPNLQGLSVYSMGKKDDIKYRDGNDPIEEEATRTARCTTYDIQMISNFRQLRNLKIRSNRLNGRYPSLFEFPLLESLDICSKYLKLDLSMLRGMPSLKVLKLGNNCQTVTGNLESLNVLKGTIESISLSGSKIKGDIIDLADFSKLHDLDLKHCSKVTGDLRDIKEGHFLALKTANLSKRIIGSRAYQFQSISDVPSVVEAVYRLSQREPTFVEENIGWLYFILSEKSPDRYESKYGSSGYPAPPFCISVVRVGPRMGWRWTTQRRSNNNVLNSCEINWLDPEPSRDSSDYDEYIRKLECVNEEIFCYEGFHQPPTEEEYKRLCEEYYDI